MKGDKEAEANRETENRLREAVAGLQENDRRFRMAVEEYEIERIIYERAALLCRCKAALKELRGQI